LEVLERDPEPPLQVAFTCAVRIRSAVLTLPSVDTHRVCLLPGLDTSNLRRRVLGILLLPRCEVASLAIRPMAIAAAARAVIVREGFELAALRAVFHSRSMRLR